MSCATTLHASQRGSAWAARMTQGETVADVASKFVAHWESDAGASAWAAAMTRGQRAPADVAGEDSGITHRCGGCQSGEPCPSCGGNIRKDHPAYQALEWGFMQAGVYSAPLWRAAAVDAALREAPGRGDDREWRVLLRLSSSVISEVSLQTQLPPYSNPTDSENPWPPGGRDLGDNPSPYDHPPAPGDSRGLPYDTIEDPTAYCCVKTFQYPKRVWTDAVFVDRTPPVNVAAGWGFTARMRYREGPGVMRVGTKPVPIKCDCKCCIFKQYVWAEEFDHSTVPPTHAGATLWTEDCKRDARGGPKCYGMEPPHPDLAGHHERSSKCGRTIKDEPKFYSQAPVDVTRIWHYRGIIIDRCHNVIRREKWFSYYMRIHVNALGEIVEDSSTARRHGASPSSDIPVEQRGEPVPDPEQDGD